MDPTRILIAIEVAHEMLQIFYRSNPTEAESARNQCDELYQGKGNLPYYTLMDFLIKLNFASTGSQLTNLRSIFKPEVVRDWDYNIGFPGDNNTGRNKLKGDYGSQQPSPAKPNQNSPQSWRARDRPAAPAGGSNNPSNPAAKSQINPFQPGNSRFVPLINGSKMTSKTSKNTKQRTTNTG
jgi:hypothetical protein